MSGPGTSLLEAVGGLIRRTYRMRPGIRDLAPYVIGDRGYRLFYADAEVARSVGSASGQGARTLVRETDAGVRMALYFPDEMIRTLESHSPLRGLSHENVQAFATLVEEIDHLLVIAERSRQGRSVSMFELELHANVSKHLVLLRFLAGGKPGVSAARRRWLQHELFEGVRYAEESDELRRRYEDAARWAARFVNALPQIGPERRLETLRRFHGVSASEKLRLIERYAA